MARYDLGLTDDEVGGLTVLQYEALLSRKQENDNRLRLNAGFVAAAIYNAAPFGDGERKAVSPLDFVPEWQGRAQAEKVIDLREMTPEEQRDYLFSIFGKRIHRER